MIYEDTDNPLSAETLALRERRRTDCLDCHNRPSHIVHSPDYLIDHLLLTDRVSPALPEIKTVAVDVLASDYDSVAAARRAIEKKLRSHYRREHPELLSAHPGQLDSAIVAVQEAYARNFFPEMNARWAVYPNNIGHFTDIGCVRCHDGLHKAEDGRAISHDCQACHRIIAQGSPGAMESAESTEDGLKFHHPEDIFEAWLEMGCYECHEGTQP